MVRLFALAAALTLPGIAPAQDAGTSGRDVRKVRSVTLYGSERCPAPTDPNEIVVCHSGGDSPYRIPPRFRESSFNPANQSWVLRSEVVQDVSRAQIPGSFSPVGTGGQTGCSRALLNQWERDQTERQVEAAGIP